MWDLSSQPGIDTMSPVVEAQSPNHWTTREVPQLKLRVRDRAPQAEHRQGP